MTAKKTITINCPPTVRQWLIEALQLYTDAAYPAGGSECAMVAREALLNVVTTLKADSETAEISKKVRAMFKSAVNYYFDRREAGLDNSMTAQRALTLEALRGTVVNDNQVAAAVALDG